MKPFKTLILTLILCSVPFVAHARITRVQVQRAWERILPHAQVKHPSGPIQYESKKEPNAWVKAQGKTYSLHITEGLMAVLNSEDQVAGILGHELGHIKKGHFSRRTGRLVLWGLLAAAVHATDNDWLLIPGAAGAALAEAGFSREQEVEADVFGVRIAAAAGYNPMGLYEAMSAMKRAGFGTQKSGFNSHPPTERRLNRLQAEARKYRWPKK